MNHELTNRMGSFGFFDPFFAPFFEEGQNECYGHLDMKTDIQDVGDGYKMEVELPGFDKKDLGLNLNDGYLTISAKVNRSNNQTDKKGRYIHRERFSGTTTRTYYVGDIDEKDIKANFLNGILTVTFPKEDAKRVAAQHTIAIE
ncbi:MAG: Hsp20/alpha crystallin family protein [Bacilli bacterium]|nr:Hsp20/alpha crystallin family protein [Bacilli bacterium]